MARKRRKTRKTPVTLRPAQSWGRKQRLKVFLRNVVAILLLSGLLFGVSRMQVTTVTVEGHNEPELVETLVREQLAAGFLWDNLVFLPKDKLSERLLWAPEILADEVKLKKRWFKRELLVHVVEREPALLWQSGSDTYSIDRNGRVIKSVTPDNSLPLVIDTSNLPVTPDTQVAPPSFIDFATQIRGEVEKQTALKPRDILVEETISEAIVTTEGGIDLRFATNLAVAGQVENVQLTLQHARASATPVTSYIDVRIPYKAYYR